MDNTRSQKIEKLINEVGIKKIEFADDSCIDIIHSIVITLNNNDVYCFSSDSYYDVPYIKLEKWDSKNG